MVATGGTGKGPSSSQGQAWDPAVSIRPQVSGFGVRPWVTSQNSVHPNPTTEIKPRIIGSRMGGEFTYQPTWDPNTVLTTTATSGAKKEPPPAGQASASALGRKDPAHPGMQGPHEPASRVQLDSQQGCGIKRFITTSVIQGNPLFIWAAGLWEALFVVSQKWSFPTALIYREATGTPIWHAQIGRLESERSGCPGACTPL